MYNNYYSYIKYFIFNFLIKSKHNKNKNNKNNNNNYLGTIINSCFSKFGRCN